MHSLDRPTAALLSIVAGLLLIACGQEGSEPRVQHLDASNYARDMRVDSEEAARRLDLQDRASALEQRLSQQEKGTFAGLWIEHEPRFRVIVQTTGEVPEEESRMKAYVPENAPLSSSIEVRKVGATLEQLISAQQASLRATRNLGVRFDSIIDVPQNRVELEVLNREAFRASLGRRGIRLPQHVEIVQVKELTVPQADIYGGVAISTCTAGWSVRNSEGVLGIATAAHCGNTQKYKGVLLPFQAESQSGSCDMQWHTDASYTAVPKFIGSSPSNIRPVTGMKPRSSQVIGGYVCKYGKITGYRCGRISTKNASLGYVTNSNNTFIRVRRINQLLSTNGDSGCPWFNGNTAYGIHSGGTTNTAVYTAIDYLPTCVGVNLLTQ
jgi:hypothetical protein